MVPNSKNDDNYQFARTDFFKMAAVAMETAKILKNEKLKNDHSGLLAEQKLMNLDRNNNHI
jgi:hypothetical protein